MARLVGVDLPRDKRLEVALTYIFGIGRTRALQTLEATGISPDLRVKDLGDEDLLKLRNYIDELLPEVLDGRINPGRVFDLELPMAEVAEAYAAMDERRAIKVLLRP